MTSVRRASIAPATDSRISSCRTAPLLLVAYRSFLDQNASWELLALVVLGGLVSTGYRRRHRAMTREAGLVVAVTIVVALAVAVLIASGIRI